MSNDRPQPELRDFVTPMIFVLRMMIVGAVLASILFSLQPLEAIGGWVNDEFISNCLAANGGSEEAHIRCEAGSEMWPMGPYLLGVCTFVCIVFTLTALLGVYLYPKGTSPYNRHRTTSITMAWATLTLAILTVASWQYINSTHFLVGG